MCQVYLPRLTHLFPQVYEKDTITLLHFIGKEAEKLEKKNLVTESSTMAQWVKTPTAGVHVGSLALCSGLKDPMLLQLC